jgi:predicted nucleic acid-binding protein
VIVADTNLLAYLHLPGQHTNVAEEVLRRDPEWAAPVLWRSEFRSVLSLYLRKNLVAMDAAMDAFDRAADLVRNREYSIETARVLDLVQQSSCSAYDCEFVALAQELGVKLVTSDSDILREFPGTAVSIDDFAA